MQRAVSMILAVAAIVEVAAEGGQESPLLRAGATTNEQPIVAMERVEEESDKAPVLHAAAATYVANAVVPADAASAEAADERALPFMSAKDEQVDQWLCDQIRINCIRYKCGVLNNFGDEPRCIALAVQDKGILNANLLSCPRPDCLWEDPMFLYSYGSDWPCWESRGVWYMGCTYCFFGGLCMGYTMAFWFTVFLFSLLGYGIYLSIQTYQKNNVGPRSYALSNQSRGQGRNAPRRAGSWRWPTWQ